MEPALPARIQSLKRSASRFSLAYGSATVPASVNPASSASVCTRLTLRVRGVSSWLLADACGLGEGVGTFGAPLSVSIGDLFDSGRRNRKANTGGEPGRVGMGAISL